MATRRRNRRKHRSIGVILACALGLAGCSGTEPREVVERPGAQSSGTGISFQLPQGIVQITVGPAQSVEAGAADSEEPSGRYIPLSWEWDLGAGVPPGTSGYVSLTSNKTATITADVDGRRYDLGSAYGTKDSTGGSGTTFYVPVDESTTAADLAVEVAFDGVVQSARGDGSSLSSGRASSLYEQEPARAAQCRFRRVPQSAGADDACTASMVRRPYVDTLGWADEGSEWLIVSLSVSTHDRKGTAKTDVRHDGEEVTVDGDAPVATLSASGHGTSDSNSVLVFQVANDKAQVRFSYTIDTDAEGTSLRGVATEG